MPPRFYLLHGLDDFAMSEFVDTLKEKLGDPAMADLNTTVFDARVPFADLRATADALPFLAPRRLVIVEGWLSKLLSKSDDGDDGETETAPASAKETLATLADYLPTLAESTALVFIEKRALPERNPILKAAANSDWGFVKFFDLPKGEALAQWIRARAKKDGGEFTREAAQALAESEPDPRALDQEILKLLTYVDFARAVDEADVQTLTPAGGEAKIFDLVDALGQRRGPAAMRELHKLLEREEPLYLLSMITRQFRLMLLAKELLEARRGENEIAQALGQKPYPTQKICAQARNHTLPGLEHIYRRLLDYDIDIKTGQVDSAAALDTLVASLTI